MLPVLHISGYRFFPLSDLISLKAWCLSSVPESVRGTIILSSEGINFSLCGPVADLESYSSRLMAHLKISCSLRRSYSRSLSFLRFFVKIKDELVAYRSSFQAYKPLPYLSVHDFHRWLERGCDDFSRPLFSIDVRNEFEYEMGTFRGAVSAKICHFNEFCQKMDQEGIPSKAAVVIFCTGGIRCEKASSWFYNQGIEAHQLEGGILQYLETFGQGFYHGSCFVFDERVSLDGELRSVLGVNK